MPNKTKRYHSEKPEQHRTRVQSVVDMDLEKYFDTVNQSKLGVVVKHRFEETEVGIPQGGNLSEYSATSWHGNTPTQERAIGEPPTAPS